MLEAEFLANEGASDLATVAKFATRRLDVLTPNDARFVLQPSLLHVVWQQTKTLPSPISNDLA